MAEKGARAEASELPSGLEEILAAFQPAGERVRQLPFSFIYDGQESSELLVKWQRTVTEKRLDATRVQRTLTFRDTDTGLVCEAQVILFSEFPAVEWVLHFRNEGHTDTPILEDVSTLDAIWPIGGDPRVIVHRSRGSSCQASDFQPMDQELSPGESIAFGPGCEGRCPEGRGWTGPGAHHASSRREHSRGASAHGLLARG